MDHYCVLTNDVSREQRTIMLIITTIEKNSFDSGKISGGKKHLEHGVPKRYPVPFEFDG